MKLDCPICAPENEKTLSDLPQGHSEYYLSVLLRDGTKRWYICSACEGVFCRDKITASWQYSPQTYTDFVQKGILADKLNG